MPPIDLTHARLRARDRVLMDRCTISRNPKGQSNAPFDETTGDYGSDPDETNVLATDVPCYARDQGLAELQVGGATEVSKTWSVKLDYTLAPDPIEIGDEIVFTTAQDPDLLGETLHVNEIVVGTLRIWRAVVCVRRSDGERRR